MTHLATRTQLARFAPFIHRPNLSLTTTLPRSQTVTLAQFSTKTVPSLLRRAQPPAMDVQPPESGKPSVEGEDFVHVQDLKMESLSESMVRIDEPSDTAAAASSPAPESPGDSDRRPVALPEELSRNVVVLSCESAAEGGVCDVYLVGTAHVSEVISSFGLGAVFAFRYISHCHCLHSKQRIRVFLCIFLCIHFNWNCLCYLCYSFEENDWPCLLFIILILVVPNAGN